MVIVVVEGGVVQHVFTEDPQVVIVDWDSEDEPANSDKGLFDIPGYGVANIGLMKPNKREDMVPELLRCIEANL